MNFTQLTSVMPRLCSEFGITPAMGNELSVRRLADKDACTVAVTIPRIVEEIELSGRVIAHGGETLVDHLIAGRDRLFAKVHAHIAEHENTRVRQLENALDEAIRLIHSRILSYGPDEYDEVARLRMIQRGTL